MFANVQKHKRSRSSLSSTSKKDCIIQEVPPIPPPRSAPTTCRRPRRNIGDTIFITSSSSVYVNYKNENVLRIVNSKETKCEQINKSDDDNNFYVNSARKHVYRDVAIFKTIVVEGYDRELQEINCFIGISRFLFSVLFTLRIL